MTSELMLRRKGTWRAHGRQVVLVKKRNESSRHVLMKALLWALYLPEYPNLTVEVPIGDRYKPDLVALDPHGDPRFWAEAGQVSTAKIRSLTRRFRRTHLVMAKWDTRLEPWIDIANQALSGLGRQAPLDLISFPADTAGRLVDDRGHLQIAFHDVTWVRLTQA